MLCKCLSTSYQDDGEPLPFRYKINPKTKSLLMVPKKLDDNIDTSAVRATMLGAFFKDSFHLVPRTDVGRICWEVSWSIFWRNIFFIIHDRLNLVTAG